MAHWQTTVGGTHHSITIIDRLVRLAKWESGPETYGGNEVPAERFLRSERLRNHVLEVFGESVLNEVVSAAEQAAEPHGMPRRP
jgi:hypothetical protein